MERSNLISFNYLYGKEITILSEFIKYLVIFSIFVSSFSSYSQKNNFKHLTVDQGLSQSWVQCMLQDKFGFMWIGTDNGLNRYDGYNFTIYKHNSKDPYSISNSCIMSLLEDNNGNLWIGTYLGLNQYDRKNNRFLHQIDWPDGFIKSIVEDENHNLWICSGNSLYYYNIKTKSFTEHEKFNQYLRNENFNISKIFIDRKQNIWIATSFQGLKLYNNKQNTFIGYKHDNTDLNSISDNTVVSLCEDHMGRLWIGTKSGLDLFTNAKEIPKRGVFIHYQNNISDPNTISKGVVKAIFEDNKNKLWIGTENGGLNLLDQNNSKNLHANFKHFVNDPGIASSINNNSIYSLFQDRQGNIWIGTFGNGINVLSPNSDKFETHNNIPGKNSLNNNHVNTFCEDNDVIWIGTEDGLNQLNKKSGTYKIYKHSPSNPSSISSNAIWSILKDSQGNLWIGSWAGGLNKFNYSTETFIQYKQDPADSNSISNNNIFSIVEDKNSNLWIGTVGGGLNFLNKKTQIFKKYNSTNSDISGNYVEAIIESKNGDLWLKNSSANGQSVERFDKETGQFEIFFHNEKDSLSLSSTKVNTIFEDSKDHIWIGTDDGLNLFNKKTKKFICYNLDEGLSDNSVRSILEDNNGNLWLGTNKGLSKFINAVNIPANPKFRNYTIEDGLQGNEFIPRSCLKSKDGKLYFGGINGFNTFYPDSIKDNLFVPNIVITDFYLFNKAVEIKSKNSPLKQNPILSDKIILNYDQSVFSFKFTSLNYIIPEKNQYAYKMEGFDKNWNYVGTKREATYTNLDPGEYIFRVKGSNNDGVWNEAGTSIKIIILPPWWQTWWFKLIIGLSIIICLAYIAIRFIKKIKHLANQTILDERNQLKTLINNIPDYIYIKDTKARFLIVNDNAIKYLGGKTEKDIINKTDFDFYPKAIAEKILQRELKIMTTGIPTIDEESKKEINGQKVYFSATKCPIINLKGETIGLVGIIRDITAQKIAKLKIHKQSEELIKYNETLNEANALLEEHQMHIEEQTEELYRQNENQKEINSILEEKQQLLEEQKEEIQAQRDELFQLNKMKDLFFSIIAHDLKSPFSAIKGLSNLLVNRYDRFEETKRFTIFKAINGSIDSIFDLLVNLLNWSRLQRGSVTLQTAQANLPKILESNVRLIANQAKEKSLAIISNYSKDEFLINVDVDLLNTVIRNLLNNAIKFTPKDGIIEIGFKPDEKFAKIWVIDNGVGIEPENIGKLFVKDLHFTTRGTNYEKGTGLGLSICKEFIEIHGGKIWVESLPGKGSSFIFNLPIR